jgi:hypothetical protein
MTQTGSTGSEQPKSPAARRFGYVVAVGVNLVLLYVVNNLLEWGVPEFLTDDFERVLPIMNFSIVANIVVNIVYLFFDPTWFKSITQIVLSVIGLIVVIRLYRVFPFDYTAYEFYEFEWEVVTRVILVLIMVGISIGIIVTTAKFVTDLVRAARAADGRSLGNGADGRGTTPQQ